MLWPLVVYFAAVIALVTSILALSWLLGQQHTDRATGEPYESGIAPTGSARLRLSADFYLIAMLFVIFDIEIVFLFPWAVVYKRLGLLGLVEMLVFLGILIVGFWYAWKKGALEWD
jgi:NADH-quinone oxidoreductase subunit A